MHRTRAGWLEGHEVTEVWFDPGRLTFEKLLAHGKSTECARRAWTTTPAQKATALKALAGNVEPLTKEPRPDKEPKYYLLQTPYKHVPMTATQAARINAALAPDGAGKAERFLSPRQRELLAQAKASKKPWPVAVDVDIMTAWSKLPK